MTFERCRSGEAPFHRRTNTFHTTQLYAQIGESTRHQTTKTSQLLPGKTNNDIRHSTTPAPTAYRNTGSQKKKGRPQARMRLYSTRKLVMRKIS